MPKQKTNPCLIIVLLALVFITLLKVPKMLQCNANNKRKIAHTAKYKVYGYMGCPYTVKQLDAFKENNISFKFMDTNTPKGSKAFSKINEGDGGVPLTIDMASGKKYHGFTEVSRMKS